MTDAGEKTRKSFEKTLDEAMRRIGEQLAAADERIVELARERDEARLEARDNSDQCALQLQLRRRAEAACAQMRAALEWAKTRIGYRLSGREQLVGDLATMEAIDAALATDAGKAWADIVHELRDRAERYERALRDISALTGPAEAIASAALSPPDWREGT